jgi:hypothetical protein
MNDGSSPLVKKKSDLRDASRLLNVYRWSEWPEVNNFVDEIYSAYFLESERSKIKKKHVKVLLLDLYVAWKEGW